MLPAAVIFDMDGLMFDTERLGQRAWHQVGEELGVEIGENILRQTRGATRSHAADVFRRILGPAFDYPAAKARRTVLAEQAIQRDGLPVKPGLYALLAALEENGIPAAVASSSPVETILRYLRMAGLQGRFSALVSGETIARSKPAPDVFLAAAQALQQRPERCLVLEDSTNGLLAAHAAGMSAICIPDIALPSEDALSHALAVLPSLDQVWSFLCSCV